MEPFTATDFEDTSSPTTFTADDFDATPVDWEKLKEEQFLAERARVPAAGSGRETDSGLLTAIAQDILPNYKPDDSAGKIISQVPATALRALGVGGKMASGVVGEALKPGGDAIRTLYNTVSEEYPGLGLGRKEPGESFLYQVPEEYKGAIPSALRFVGGLGTPENIAAIPFAGLKPVQALFGAGAAASIPQGIQQIIDSKSGAETRGAITDTALNALLAGVIGKHLEKGGPNARSIQEAAKVYGDVRSQPLEGEGQVPTTEGRRGVQPPAQGVAEAAQISLSPEQDAQTRNFWDNATDHGRLKLSGARPDLRGLLWDQLAPHEKAIIAKNAGVLKEAAPLSPEEQAYLDEERKGIDTPIEVVDKLSDEANQPFASGRMATVRSDGTIELNRSVYQRWLKGVPPEQRAGAVQSLVAEEGNHKVFKDATTPEERAGFWDDMTEAEKRLHLRIYTGEWSLEKAEAAHGVKLTPEQLGYEAANAFQMRLANMTRREIAEAVGREKWTVKTLDNLQNLIFKTREAFGTKASTRQRELLDRAESGLKIARSVAMGQGPSALAKDQTKPEDIADHIGGKFDGEMMGRWQFTLFDESGKPGTSILVKKGAPLEDVVAKYNAKRESYISQGDKANAPRPIETRPQWASEIPSSSKLSAQTLDEFKNYHDSIGNPSEQRKAVTRLADTFANESDIGQAESLAKASRFKTQELNDEFARRREAGETWDDLKGVMEKASMENQRTQFLDEAARTARAVVDVKKGHSIADAAKFYGANESAVKQIIEPEPEAVTALDPRSGSPLSATESFINRLEPQRGPAALRKGKNQPYDPEQEKLLKHVTGMGVPGEEKAVGERAVDVKIPEEAKRIKVSPEEIGFDQPYKQLPFRAITESESKSPQELSDVLTSDARIGGSDLPVGASKRVLVMQNKNDGTVHMVSVYPYRRGNEAIARVTDPDLGGARPNRPIEDLLPTYKPLYSVLLKEPKQNFRQKFDTLADFYNHFGDEATRMAREHGTGFGEIPQEEMPAPYVSEPRDIKRPTDSEAKAIYDFFGTEPPSSADMFERSLIRTSAKSSRQMVSGIKKLWDIEKARNRNLSDSQALENVLDKLYENITTTDTRQDFIQRTLAQSGAAPAEAVQVAQPSKTGRELTTLRSRAPTAVEGQVLPKTSGPEPQLPAPTETAMLPPEGVAEVASQIRRSGTPPQFSATLYRQLAHRQVPKEPYTMGKSKSIQEEGFVEPEPTEGQQELFTDREVAEIEQEALPPLRPEPESLAQEKRVIAKGEGNVGQLDLWQPRKSGQGPAALLKAQNAVKDTAAKAAEEALKTADVFSAYMKRRATDDQISAQRDVADNTANILADQVEKSINLESAQVERNKLGFKKKGSLPEGDPKVKAGANAVVQAGAFKPKYNIEGEALTRFREVASNDPQAKALRNARSSGDPEIKKNVRNISKGIYDRTIQTMLQEGTLSHENVEYRFDDSKKAELNNFLAKVERGRRAAQQMMQSSNFLVRRKGRAWLHAADELGEEVDYAKEHWGEKQLMDTALAARRELDAQYDREKTAGSRLRYGESYLPGRYDAEFFNDNAVAFSGIRLLGRQFRAPKTFDNYYDAIQAGPYIPATRDVAAIVSSRVRQGMREVNKKKWQDALKNIQDPETKKPVVQSAITRPDGSFAPPDADHELVYIRPGYDPVAVRKSYLGLINNMIGRSALQNASTPIEYAGRFALENNQAFKHIILAMDLFHLGRLKYYDWSISGIGKGGYSKGLSALEYRPHELDRAVEKGLITPESAAWVKGTVPVNLGVRTVDMTRYDLAKHIVNQGLNVGRIQDAIYKDLISHWPVLGQYNKWLFDKFTRGLMMQTAVKEFERLNKAHPDMDSRAVMRDVAKDLNTYFASIGRQGWIKNPTLQDLTRLPGLSPQWVEGLITKEATQASRLTGASKLLGRQGVPYLGVAARGLTRGLTSMVILTQLANLITRRQPTWKNEEEGHKWDAWIPNLSGKGDGFWFSPLSLFNEVTHDIVRLTQTKPKVWDAITQIGENKLGPWGKSLRVLVTGENPMHQKIGTTGGVLAEAAKQLVPVPISLGRVGQAALHRVAPGMVPPVPTGAMQRQMFGSAGIKMEPAQSQTQQLMQKADNFMRREGLKKETGYELTPTDEASYSKLRTAIRNKDVNGAKSVLKDLLKGRTEDQVIKSMALWAKRPFTGSALAESQFIDSLSDKEMEMYQRAMVGKQQELQEFIDFMISRGTP